MADTTFTAGMSSNLDPAFLLNQDEITICLKDGYKFWEANAEIIARRFSDPSKKTTIIIVHPDSPAMEQVAAMDPDKNMEIQRSDCIEAVRIMQIIREIALKNGSAEAQNTFDDRVTFVGHDYVPTWNGFIGDAVAIINTYATGPAPKGPMPSMTISGEARDYVSENCQRLVAESQTCHASLFDYEIPDDHVDKRSERTIPMDAELLRARLNAALSARLG